MKFPDKMPVPVPGEYLKHFYSHRDKFEISKDGGESLVFGLKGGKYRNIVFVYDQPKLNVERGTLKQSEARKIFNIHRILNILFPKNFPRFYAIYGISDNIAIRSLQKVIDLFKPIGRYGSLRRKIEGEEYQEIDVQAPNSLNSADNIMRSLGVELHLDIKNVEGKNILLTNEGNQYYVDMVGSLPVRLNGEKSSGLACTRIAKSIVENEERILKYMNDNGYSENASHIVKQSLESLKK